MKKIFIVSCVLILSIFIIPEIFAAGTIEVKVSEDLSQLGLDCDEPDADGYTTCRVEKGFSSVQTMLGEIIQYATFLIGLVGVLFIVINGIMYSIGGEDKSGAKDRIMKSVMGLMLLLLSGVVLNAIAPWIYGI